jgi:high-affinity Fe2+/Pb2+ permease
MNLFDYFITPADLWRMIRRFRTRDVLGVIVALLLIFGIPTISTLSLEESFFLIFLIAMFFWRIDSRVSIGLALACLVLAPIFLYGIGGASIATASLGNDGAHALAVWAFYFLSIGVIKQIWELRRGE